MVKDVGQKPMPLTENDVIDACAKHLSGAGYVVEKVCRTSERGVDIVARCTRTGSRIFVEAKGATSSKSHSARFGRPFDRGQARSHVSRALFEAARLASSAKPGDEAALAFPADTHHESLVEEILPALGRLPASVFWVSNDGEVRWWRGSSAQHS
jgi:hypothetical protein